MNTSCSSAVGGTTGAGGGAALPSCRPIRARRWATASSRVRSEIAARWATRWTYPSRRTGLSISPTTSSRPSTARARSTASFKSSPDTRRSRKELDQVLRAIQCRLKRRGPVLPQEGVWVEPAGKQDDPPVQVHVDQMLQISPSGADARASGSKRSTTVWA